MAGANGWKYADLVKRLEATRKAKSAEFYAAKKASAAKLAKAQAALGPNEVLAAGGFM